MTIFHSLLYVNFGKSHWKVHTIRQKGNYKGSPDSMNFGPQENRVIRGIVLIWNWLSTKIRDIGQFAKIAFFMFVNGP